MSNPFVQLHISILLAGFTGILGKLIQLAEGPLTWYRLLICIPILYVYLRATGTLPAIPFREKMRIAGVGTLIALHWLFFYGSLKYANVSIAVVCFAMSGFFTAIIEPLASKSRISVRELCFSLITVAGIVLIFHFDVRYRTGIILGVICAFFAALFTVAMRRVGANHEPTTMLFYQISGGWVFLCLIAPLYLAFFPGTALVPGLTDFFYLSILAVACTIGMILLQLRALRKISAFTVNLSYNLEPVYSILLAMLLLGEASELNTTFFVGLGLICLSVILQSVYAAKQRGGIQ